jgi:ribonucleoside-diphosphate reductase alpha chain
MHTESADRYHGMKYRGRRESFKEYANRVSFGLADNGDHYHELRDILLEQRFCPGGRIQGSIGATRRTTSFNCYVSGTINDSLVDGDGSIMQRLTESAQTAKLGGGIGYDFSTLRPRGYRVKQIESDATGPVSFMSLYNVTGLTMQSSGHRRGAQMGILRVDHPDIEEFIFAKQVPSALEGFNISVAVTDAFMEAVANDALFPLSFGGQTDREVRAVDLWQKIMRSTWEWAEPGVFFVDTVNKTNNLWYCEQIAACNPCGEQPLPPYGACLLGSFNLVKYLSPNGLNPATTNPAYDFSFDQLRVDILAVVRAMDNVVDRSLYPWPAQAQEAYNKRRMGLGVMGLANAGEALGNKYGSPGFLEFEAKVLETIRDECYRASIELAKEKGPFPLFASPYTEGKFIQTLPPDIQDGIVKHGIRNSHLTSIAPTGTISLCADNVSSGIEPVFAYKTERPIMTPEGRIVDTFEDYGAQFLSVRGKVCDEVTADEHVAVLLTAQRYVDSAVSKTCNVNGSMPWADFVGIYSKVHAGGGKGCTTFNRDGKRGALLTSAPSDELTCAIDEIGRRSCE